MVDDRFDDGRIMIRKYSPDDAGAVYEMAFETLPDLMPWMDWAHPGYSLEDAEKWVLSCVAKWNRDDEYHFLVCDAETGALLGAVGLLWIGKKRKIANMGYWTRTKEQKKGVATAAARLCARFAFEQLGVARVEILANVANVASLRVGEKVGSIREGVLRNRVVVHGESRDGMLFSLIPGDV